MTCTTHIYHRKKNKGEDYKKMKLNGPGRSKFLTVGKACMAIFKPI